MDVCTIHQRLTAGIPMVRGSEVRLPDGTPIPGVTSIRTEADPALSGLWRTTITLHALMGEPLHDGVPVIDPSPPAPAPDGVEE